MADGKSVVNRIAKIIDAIGTGEGLDDVHDQWGESPQQNLDDQEIMSHCANCGQLSEDFWLYLTRLNIPVVFKCKYTSPLSLFLFLVCRKAHLSQYRLKHGQFNESELARITKALSDMSAVQFRVYDARRVNVDLKLDDDESHVVVSL